MGPLGVPEMFAIFVIALLLFGPKKLPELGRTLGKALSEFRRAKNELKGTFESHLRELERETQITSTSSSSNSPTNYSPSYSYPYEDYNHSDLPAYSEPSKIEGTEELRASLPPAAGEMGPPLEHSGSEHEGVPASPPVAGTVARSNGVRPLEENVEPQEHRAEAREEHPV
jgi:TatA/E family protein of Tat protein translocase